MDLTKSYEFFKPETVQNRIHIVGCGSVGSTVAENLARCGLTKFTLYDFDKVEGRNIVNQMFTQKQVGMYKTDALRDILCEINPDIAQDVKVKQKGWQGELLSGWIFLCVDSIDIRREFVEKHMNSPFVDGVFDFRTLLTGAQHYAANWKNPKMKEYLLSTMQFSHDEAAAAAPVSACGATLGVCQTVRVICGFGTSNFVNMAKGRPYKKFIQYVQDENGVLFVEEYSGE